MVDRFSIFFSIVTFLCFAVTAQAQDNHFLYIQSEDGQPFYAKLDGRLHSSTASGYIIISKLQRGEYRLSIGFPRNEFPEQEYPIIIADENQGLLLKDRDNQKILVNIGSQVPITSLTVEPERKAIADTIPTETPVQTDLFSSLLADAVRDSSLLRPNRPVIEKTLEPVTATAESAKNEPAMGAVKNAQSEPVTVAEESVPESTTAAEKGIEPIKEEASHEAVKSGGGQNPIKRVLMVNQEDGQDMIYVNSATQDTIRLFVPGQAKSESENSGAKIIYKPEAAEEESLTITPTIVKAPETAAEEKKEEPAKTARIIYEPDSSNQQKDAVQAEPEHKIKATSSVNSDCTAFASEKDFLRLRRRMAGERDAMKMIDAARRFFKSKCYTTEQVRNLSYLFMDDLGKYQFFDAAYPYVSDSNLFSTLESQLEDSYYINRFKAMIQK